MTTMDDTMAQGGYVSAAKAAEATSRHISTIHRQAARGDLEHTKAGRDLYIKVSSLRALYADNEVILQAIDGLGVG